MYLKQRINDKNKLDRTFLSYSFVVLGVFDFAAESCNANDVCWLNPYPLMIPALIIPASKNTNPVIGGRPNCPKVLVVPRAPTPANIKAIVNNAACCPVDKVI